MLACCLLAVLLIKENKMPRYIIHHDGLFFEYSTVVDAPVTCAMTENEFREYYINKNGDSGLVEVDERMQRAIKKGCSGYFSKSAEDELKGNRAGPNETELSFNEVIALTKAARKEFGFEALKK